MTDATIAADVHQTLDVHLNFTAEFTFSLILVRNDVTDGILLFVGPILNFLGRFNACLAQDLLCERSSNAENVG